MEKTLVPERKNNQLVGNIGLYYCCYHLSKQGWNVMPTSRNARGIDIVAYTQDLKNPRFVSIQVKSLSKRNPVPMGKSKEGIMGDYWVIVNNIEREPTAYILTPEEISDLTQEMWKDEKRSCWLQPKDYCKENFKDKWERIK